MAFPANSTKEGFMNSPLPHYTQQKPQNPPYYAIYQIPPILLRKPVFNDPTHNRPPQAILSFPSTPQLNEGVFPNHASFDRRPLYVSHGNQKPLQGSPYNEDSLSERNYRDIGSNDLNSPTSVTETRRTSSINTSRSLSSFLQEEKEVFENTTVETTISARLETFLEIFKKISDLSTIPSDEELEKIAVLRCSEQGKKYIKGTQITFYFGDTIFNLFNRGVKTVYKHSNLKRNMNNIANRMDNLTKNKFFYKCMEATFRQAEVIHEKSTFADRQSTNPHKRKVSDYSHSPHRDSTTDRHFPKRRGLEKYDTAETPQIPLTRTSLNQTSYSNQPVPLPLIESFPRTKQILLQYANSSPILTPVMSPIVTGRVHSQLNPPPPKGIESVNSRLTTFPQRILSTVATQSNNPMQLPLNLRSIRHPQSVVSTKAPVTHESVVLSSIKPVNPPTIPPSSNSFVDKILKTKSRKRHLPPIPQEPSNK